MKKYQLTEDTAHGRKCWSRMARKVKIIVKQIINVFCIYIQTKPVKDRFMATLFGKVNFTNEGIYNVYSPMPVSKNYYMVLNIFLA